MKIPSEVVGRLDEAILFFAGARADRVNGPSKLNDVIQSGISITRGELASVFAILLMSCS